MFLFSSRCTFFHREHGRYGFRKVYSENITHKIQSQNLLSQISHMPAQLCQILNKQEHKVSYRCSLPSPLQKRSKDQKGLHWCQNPAEDLLASTLKITRSSKTMDTCGALNSRSPLLGSGTNAILFDPWIFSAMAMAMSIYRTLCVLVSTSVPLFLFS